MRERKRDNFIWKDLVLLSLYKSRPYNLKLTHNCRIGIEEYTSPPTPSTALWVHWPQPWLCFLLSLALNFSLLLPSGNIKYVPSGNVRACASVVWIVWGWNCVQKLLGCNVVEVGGCWARIMLNMYVPIHRVEMLIMYWWKRWILKGSECTREESWNLPSMYWRKWMH